MSIILSKNVIIILIILMLIMIFMISGSKQEKFNGKIEKVTSYEDNISYMVQQELPDKQRAANMLSKVNKMIINFIDDLLEKYPDDTRVHRLKQRYNPKTISEGTPLNPDNETSYSLDKGKELVVCLRQKNDVSKFHHINIITFVIIHELGHICSKTYGHNKEFNINFKWLLKNAIDMGYYKYEDYSITPINYCGLNVSSTPI